MESHEISISAAVIIKRTWTECGATTPGKSKMQTW
jgi:hypothetical protein